jgi:hypothetical protein
LLLLAHDLRKILWNNTDTGTHDGLRDGGS